MSHSMPELGWTIRRTKKAVRSELAQAPKAARAEIAKSLTAKPYKQGKTEEEANAAGAEAFRGALVGAAKWGLIAGGLGAVGYFVSPIYRGLTVQFKVYIQLSGMTFGGWIEADRRLRAYEFQARRERKRENDEAVWKGWEAMIEQQERKEQEQKQDKG